MTGMADELEVDTGATQPRPRANGRMSRDEFHAADRAAFLAGDGEADEDGSDPVEPPAKAKAQAPAKKSPKAEEPDEDGDHDLDDDTDDEDLDDEDDIDETAGESDDEDEDPEDVDTAKADDDDKPEDDDAETAKRRARLRKAEQFQRQRLAQERAAFQAEVQRERAALKADLDELAEYRSLKQRAKYDPAGVLAKYGYTDDDYEAASRDLYARSKAAAADPKARDAAARMQQQREAADKVSKLERELEEMKRAQAERDVGTAAAHDAERLLGRIAKVATKIAETPLMAKLVKANPGRAKALFAEAHIALTEQHGVEPSPARVARVCEKLRRRELRELGVDIPDLKTAPAKPGAKTKPDIKKAGDKTTAARKGAATEAEPTKDRRAMRESIVAELEAGDFD